MWPLWGGVRISIKPVLSRLLLLKTLLNRSVESILIVEARKLEHHSPHALKVNYKGS